MIVDLHKLSMVYSSAQSSGWSNVDRALSRQVISAMESANAEPKRIRILYTPQQLHQLEEFYQRCKNFQDKDCDEQAAKMGIAAQRVRNWANNRRHKDIAAGIRQPLRVMKKKRKAEEEAAKQESKRIRKTVASACDVQVPQVVAAEETSSDGTSETSDMCRLDLDSASNGSGQPVSPVNWEFNDLLVFKSREAKVAYIDAIVPHSPQSDKDSESALFENVFVGSSSMFSEAAQPESLLNRSLDLIGYDEMVYNDLMSEYLRSPEDALF